MKQYSPQYVGTVTRYVFIDSPDVTSETFLIKAYEISEGAMVKETCFGLQVTGMPDEVDRIIREIRTLDPAHIFVKDRGFPPGDPRRCRANLGGARPGYYGHEFEIGLIRFVSYGLEHQDERASETLEEAGDVRESVSPLDVKKLKALIEAEEK